MDRLKADPAARTSEGVNVKGSDGRWSMEGCREELADDVVAGDWGNRVRAATDQRCNEES